MPSAGLLARHVPQPKPRAGSVLDWSHPLAHRLCFALLLNEWGTTTNCRSLVGQTAGAFTGSTKPSWVGGAKAGLNFPGGANTVGYLTFGAETFATDLGRNTSNPATFACRVYVGGAGCIAARNDGNTISAGWQIEQSVGSSLFYVHESSSVNMTVSVVLSAGQWYDVAIVTDGSMTAANQRVYVNGILRAHASDANGSGTPASDAAQTLYVGRSNANYGLGQTSFAGTIDWFYAWKRALSTSEVLALTLAPYAFVRDPALAFVGAQSSGVASSVLMARPRSPHGTRIGGRHLPLS